MRRQQRRLTNERGRERRRGAEGGPPDRTPGLGDEERGAYGPGYRREEPPDYPDEAEREPAADEDEGPGPYAGRLRRGRRGDDELRRAVEAALFYDTWVDADRIRVEVDDAVVTLRGSLNDRSEIERAESHVRAVGGARDVRSELRVASRRAADRPHG